MSEDNRVETYQFFEQHCFFCRNNTMVSFIVKGSPINICAECAAILKGLIKDE